MKLPACTCLGLFISAVLVLACNSEKKKQSNLEKITVYKEGTFGFDLEFLNKYQDIIVLTAPDRNDSKAIVSASFQGRVMTTSAAGEEGNSYGWINYDLIKSGKLTPHMNAFGGEDRIWLSPEGGQYSVYFKKGKTFEFENWQTPAAIDSEAFDIISQDSSSVTFLKRTKQINYLGTTLDITLRRKVSMLSREQVAENLQIGFSDDLKYTAYQSQNEITNEGADWSEETGLLGIWILGMFRPSDKTTIVAPVTTRSASKTQLTSDYFGQVPSDRLTQTEAAVFLKADGKYRSKIGLGSASSTSVAGSYNSEKQILTIIQFDNDLAGLYLKSTWKLHDKPFGGDVFNAYNDGLLDDGTQMGPFYELESSSKTVALKSGSKLSHIHSTYHFEGEKSDLELIARKLLGVGLNDIERAFQ